MCYNIFAIKLITSQQADKVINEEFLLIAPTDAIIGEFYPLNKPMIYPIVIIPIIVGCIAQSIKFLLFTIKHKKIELKFIFISGHMPSAHTAFVVSLVTVIAFFDGIYSTTFAISFVLTYIVVYDALKIRTNIGYNGKTINKLIREITEIEKEDYPILRERVGHKPLEVLVGAILGFTLTIFLIIILEKL